MERIKFTKMQGLGNDYIYIDGTKNVPENLPDLAIKMSDRHFGVGSDGLVVIAKSDVADFKMIMLNADGSYGEMCGNASRCIAKYVYEKGLTNKTTITLETLAGIKTLVLDVKDGKVVYVSVDMGLAILQPEKIPVLSKGNFVEFEALGKKIKGTAVSMGNPHVCIFVDDVFFDGFETLGAAIEKHPIFPKKVNVEFIKVIDKQNIEMRVFERGSGETLACGTGACASVIACVLNGYAEKDNVVKVKLRGGDLFVEYKSDGRVIMQGGAEFVFEGEYLYA